MNQTPLPGGPQQTLLLIDDDPVVHAILGACLHGTGFELIVALSGAEGLKAVAASRDGGTPIRGIFLDNMLGDMRGVDVAAEIARSESSSVPVIFVSAHPETEVRTLFPDLPVSCFLQKPFVSKDVRAALQQVGLIS